MTLLLVGVLYLVICELLVVCMIHVGLGYSVVFGERIMFDEVVVGLWYWLILV